MNLHHAIALFAQAAADEAGPSVVSTLIVLFAPLVLLLILFVMLVRTLKRQKPLQNRSLEHMDRLEARADEAIGLLREIRDRLRDGGT